MAIDVFYDVENTPKVLGKWGLGSNYTRDYIQAKEPGKVNLDVM